MKYIFAILCFIVSIANAEPIRVQGIGNTFEQAKDSAFKTAIEMKIGSVLVSTQESNNGQLVRNDILNYSSGYIDNYKIIDRFNQGNQWFVTVDVEVSSNKIADRILGMGSNPKIVESKHYIQYQTYITSKHNGDRLLQQVMNDYPAKAFTVNQNGLHKLAVDTYRNGILEIPLEFRWNYNYLTALDDTLSLLEDGSNGFLRPSPATITVQYKDPKNLVFGKTTAYKFNDLLIADYVKNRMLNNPPRIQITITGKGNIVYRNCFVPDSFTGRQKALFSARNNLFLYGNEVEKNIIKIQLQNMPTLLRDAENIDLAVVAHESCL
jgi:hypothetical protein